MAIIWKPGQYTAQHSTNRTTNENKNRVISLLIDYRKYRKEGLTKAQIADMWGMSPINMSRFLKKYGEE